MTSVLDINNLEFSWPNSTRPLLKVEEFQVSQGEHLFLQGPSGSGKSTLLNIIAGVLTPQKGDIHLFGNDFQAYTAAQKDKVRGDHMGFIFQMFNLLPFLSIIENVTLPCQFSKVKKDNVFDKGLSLEKEACRLLKELDLDIQLIGDKKVSDLSVGQQQRVAAARALIGSPKLIIADEPTSALDADVRDRFLQLLFKECKTSETSLVFVSHDLSLGRQFDKVLSLKDINKASPMQTQSAEVPT